jgi:hypothetical protein
MCFLFHRTIAISCNGTVARQVRTQLACRGSVVSCIAWFDPKLSVSGLNALPGAVSALSPVRCFPRSPRVSSPAITSVGRGSSECPIFSLSNQPWAMTSVCFEDRTTGLSVRDPRRDRCVRSWRAAGSRYERSPLLELPSGDLNGQVVSTITVHSPFLVGTY